MIRLEEDRLLFVGWIPVVVTINNTYVTSHAALSLAPSQSKTHNARQRNGKTAPQLTVGYRTTVVLLDQRKGGRKWGRKVVKWR